MPEVTTWPDALVCIAVIVGACFCFWVWFRD